MEEESWLPVVGYEGLYEVSDLGGMRSLDRVITRVDGVLTQRRGVLMRPKTDRNGYRVVVLSKKYFFVHRLVCLAFFGSPPDGCNDVNHKDFCTGNNRTSNLEWVSRSENLYHSSRAGRYHRVPPRKTPPDTVDAILTVARETCRTLSNIGLEFGVTGSTVCDLVGKARVVRPARPKKAKARLISRSTADEIRLLRGLRSPDDVASTYGISRIHVRNLWNGAPQTDQNFNVCIAAPRLKGWSPITSPSAPAPGL